jgi:hypothetical protein
MSNERHPRRLRSGEAAAAAVGGYAVAAASGEVPPNPLVMAPPGSRTRKCTVVLETGACPEYIAYVDSWTGDGLCIRHARAINDLPDMIAKREATVEMAMMTLANMTSEAVSVIGQIMSDEDVPPGIRLKAATEVLDRTGLVKTTEVRVGMIADTGRDMPGTTASAEVRDRLNRLASAANVIIFPTHGEERAEIQDGS